RSHGKCCRRDAVPVKEFFSGERRERLQKTAPGFSFSPSRMNDFPIPEDPPVTMTAENGGSASLSEGTTGDTADDSFSRSWALARFRLNPTHTLKYEQPKQPRSDRLWHSSRTHAFPEDVRS